MGTISDTVTGRDGKTSNINLLEMEKHQTLPYSAM
jgi:hypothetical protein